MQPALLREIKITLPWEILLSLNLTEEQLGQAFCQSLAFQWFAEGRLSTGTAAREDWQSCPMLPPHPYFFTREPENMKQQGFTLLEAIVALVLIATTGITLLNWINTNLLTLQRLQHLQQRHEAIRNALVFMDNVNPMERPHGEETLGIYTFNWEATVIEFTKRGVNAGGAKSTFDVVLYQTEVKVASAGAVVAQLTIRQVGFKQLYKDLQDDDF